MYSYNRQGVLLVHSRNLVYESFSTHDQFVEDALHSRLVDARAEGAEFGEELEEVERHVTVVARLHLVHHRKHVVTHVVDERVSVHVFLLDGGK